MRTTGAWAVPGPLGRAPSPALLLHIPSLGEGARGAGRSGPEREPHLHQKSTCWKLLGTMRSRFPFSFLGSTSMAEGSGLLELPRTRHSKDSKAAIRVGLGGREAGHAARRPGGHGGHRSPRGPLLQFF